MTKRTRYFLAGSMMVLIIGLCTGLVAYYNGGLTLRASLSAPDDLAYLPADARIVAYANVRQIMDSELRQRLRQVLPAGEGKEQLLAETGIDVEKDIDTVVAGLSGDNRALASAVVVLVRGRFKEERIQQLLQQHGGTMEEYHGKRLVVDPGMPNPAGDAANWKDGQPHGANARMTGCVAFLEPGLVALGDAAAVKRAIDARGTGENVVKNADMMKFISDVDSSSNTWVVGRFDAVTGALSPGGFGGGLPQDAADHLSMVQWFALAGHVNGGMSGSVRVQTRDDKSGDDLRDIVRGGLAAAHLIGGQNVQVEQLMKTLQVSGSGKNIKVSFSVPSELLDVANGLAGLQKVIGR